MQSLKRKQFLNTSSLLLLSGFPASAGNGAIVIVPLTLIWVGFLGVRFEVKGGGR